MFKKFLSVLLAVMMVASVMTVAIVTTHAADLDPTKLYFDATTTEWSLTGKGKSVVSFFVFNYSDEENEFLAWGDKGLRGTLNSELGLYEYDPAANEMELVDGRQYRIIFYSPAGQTGTLLFDTTCLGHVGYCDGTTYEGSVDSSITALAAFWKDMDASVVGPILEITSTGKVIGTCPAEGTTPYSIFETFLTDTGAQSLANARQYSGMDDQALLDSIGAGLGLSKDDISKALSETSTEAAWDYATSTLPEGSSDPSEEPTEEPTVHTHTPGEVQIENDHASTCKDAGSYDEVVYCTECGNELSRETKYHELAAHTPGDVQIENDNASTCKDAGSYDEVTYCSVCGVETSRETKYHELAAHTPGDVQIENDNASTCKDAGSYDEVTYCSVCGVETSRETKYHELAAHTPGDVQIENDHASTCKDAGSYDEVVYCTECGNELSRETKYHELADHQYTPVAEQPAVGSTPGMLAHFKCSVCDKLFVLENEQYVEKTAADLEIAPEYVRGDADKSGTPDIVDAAWIQRWLLGLVSADKFDERAADADQDGEVTIIDATLIQRVVTGICDWDKKPVALS